MAGDDDATTSTTTPKPLTAAELLSHPEYPHVIWPLEPEKKGKAEVGKGRGSPAEIYWEVHGKGPVHLIWIMGLGAFHTAWQRQTLHFGHTPSHRDRYTSLVIDNRGVGESSAPWSRYTTSIMAGDVLDVLDAIGWTTTTNNAAAPRQLHIIGVSMGGMIAQELALMINPPDRIASLSIVSSAARLVNTVGFWENLRQRVNLFIPKAIDPQLVEIKQRLFYPPWAAAPDEDTNYPGGGRFPTNGDRFAAQELQKRADPTRFTKRGFVLQAIAAGWHHKTAAQLRELADKVGRDRIQVMHGRIDNMVTYPHGEVLAKELGVPLRTWADAGHVLMMEKKVEFNDAIEGFVEKTEAMGK